MEEQLYKLKKLLKDLEKIKGRHTELVSVYVPSGHNIVDMINQIRNEQGTAENIKSKTVRKNVTGALEKILQHLRLYKKTPENGVIIFAGNVSEKEGVSDIRLWAIEPPELLNTKMYWCNQKFELEPLKDMVEEKELYGLLVMDNKEASIGLLKGKRIELLKRMDSIVPSKSIKGGQSQQRFQRVREGLINDWYKEIAESLKNIFPKEIKGIIIGGPGPAKDDFLRENHLQTDIKKQVLGVKSTGYTDEHGLEELVERSEDLLKEAAVAKEKALVQKFFEGLRKGSGFVTYGKDNVLKALKMGAVDIILVSEDLEIVDTFVELSKEYGTKVEIISRDTREGEQLFQLGGIAAILRWKV